MRTLTTRSFEVRVDATDANLAGVTLAIDGAPAGSLAAGPFAFPVANLALGTHTLLVTSTDLAGQSSTGSVTVTVSADGEPVEPSEPSDPPGAAPEITGGCSSAGGSAGLLVGLGTLLARRRRRRA